jgi:hypothetical protein
MNVPGFTAEASLNRTTGKYPGNTLWGSAGVIEISPMLQQFTAGSIENRLWPPPWVKRVPCCSSWFGRPICTYYYVPVWYQCDVVYNPYACWICRPPVLVGTAT